MIKLPKAFYEEYDRLLNHEVLNINQYELDSLELSKQKIINSLSPDKKYIFVCRHETIADFKYLDEIYKLIDDFNIDAVISSSTTTVFPKSAHPLTNLLMWREVHTRKNISWECEESIRIFDESFYYGKKVTENKKYRGILSVRKENILRDYLFDKNPKINDGIVRYAKWPHNLPNLSENKNDIDKFPLLSDVIKEYENSYFSFIVESDHGDTDTNPTTNLTEKTLIGLLTGNMPIILGGRGIISDLENIGIKVWNEEFGFDGADLYSNHSKYKIDSFIKCIENVNKLSMSEIKEYWNKNKKIIQNNYDLISYILFDDTFKL
jgi:hypothetical protein